MKKSIVLLALLATIASILPSCTKEENHKLPITTTVNKDLVDHESFTFILPHNSSDNLYKIVTQAQHASVSLVSIDAAGNDIYQYTPALDYSGSDRVVVANEEEHGQSKCGNHDCSDKCGSHHNCSKGKDNDQDNIVIFNITSKTPLQKIPHYVRNDSDIVKNRGMPGRLFRPGIPPLNKSLCHSEHSEESLLNLMILPFQGFTI